MSDYSNLGKMPVIDSTNYKDYIDVNVDGKIAGRGLIPRDFSKIPRGAVTNTSRISLPRMSRQEIIEAIKESERTKSRLVDHCDYYNIKVKNQGQTNFCWVYAPVHCVEIIRSKQKAQRIELSPESVGGPITNYSNVGGWATNAIEYITKYGIVPSSLWPKWQITPSYMTEKAKAERQKYKIEQFWELEYKNFEQLCICLLMGYPVAIGLDWWRHEVTCLSPVILKNGGLGVIIDNSWGESWGDKGRGVLTESQALGDMFAPRVVIQ